MNELYKEYQELFSNTDKWNYYSTTVFNNPFASFDNSQRFVSRFIERAGKAKGNILYDNIQRLDENRIKHIVSVFFLGTLIYYNVETLKRPIDRLLERFRSQNPFSRIEFSFIWFLICLFHDLGYFIEETKEFESFEDFISDKVKYFLNHSVGVPSVYEHSYENYFNFRLNSKNIDIRKPDHGICGGILLFNELNEILKEKQRDNFIEGLTWNKKLVNIYKHASWVILSHNIFFIRKGDSSEQEYRNNNLNDLILNDNEVTKVDIKKHSFLFLLMLVDSIDPVKILGGYDVLKKIKFLIQSNELHFRITDTELRTRFFEKVNSLKNWLIPHIIENGNTIKIIIK
jgi:hypothetical protein